MPRFTLPDGTTSISIGGETFTGDDGVVTLPDQIVTDYGEHLAAHGLNQEAPVSADADPLTLDRKGMFAWLKARDVALFKGATDDQLRAKVLEVAAQTANPAQTEA